ncbi:glycosyltransferase [Oceanicoccus sagamiensis]|uniref:Glycosyltransferase 2-like domain-containing protein n=1 Tax=Oceanicoccus sagamiensis TaxID=716816 RepID=A0A1X9NBU4_9GAMM|nr:glycosyltransferase [Oceanicoccus sagamiensis]ARN74514.1 hypothetical protein BST96_10520 [Oceanicoccus sagamiensis]
MVERKISVIIPAYNEAKTLPVLVDSVLRFLGVHFELQIVVVDNGSDDDLYGALQDYDLVYKRLDDKVYPSVARNIGASLAQHHVLVFFDGDTEILAPWAARIDDIWGELSADAALVTGAKCIVPHNPSFLEKYWFGMLGALEAPGYINGCNIITNRTTFNRVDGFDSRLETGEDVDFSSRCKAAGAVIRHDAMFKLIHHGYPKSLKGFINRETWHSKGDFLDFSHFINSRVAVLSVVFLLLHIAALLFIPWSGYLSVCSLVLLVLLCLLSSYIKFQQMGLKQLLLGSVIFYLYFLGRAIGFVHYLRDKIVGPKRIIQS